MSPNFSSRPTAGAEEVFAENFPFGRFYLIKPEKKKCKSGTCPLDAVSIDKFTFHSLYYSIYSNCPFCFRGRHTGIVDPRHHLLIRHQKLGLSLFATDPLLSFMFQQIALTALWDSGQPDKAGIAFHVTSTDVWSFDVLTKIVCFGFCVKILFYADTEGGLRFASIGNSYFVQFVW